MALFAKSTAIENLSSKGFRKKKKEKGKLAVYSANSSYLSGVVHTGVEVCRMDSEMSRLVEQPWL